MMMIAIAVVFGLPFTKPYTEIFPFPRDFFSGVQLLGYAAPTKKTLGSAEFLPGTADIPLLVETEEAYLNTGAVPKRYIVPDTVYLTSLHTDPESRTIETFSEKPYTLTLNTMYFPNWRAAIDNTDMPVSQDDYGRITIDIPDGKHTLRLWFGYQPVEIMGITISVIGLILFVIAVIAL